MNTKTWRFIKSNPLPAAMNMAIDEGLMKTSTASLPVLRVYSWCPPAVSTGYFQKMREEIDVEFCKDNGIDVVRRPTGGRAVLHDAELTYSIVIEQDMLGVSMSVVESYHMFAEGLVAGLQKLGVQCEMTNPRQRGSRRSRSLSAACFDSPSWYEIGVSDKKLVGSAQVRYGGVILQHGSILIEFDAVKAISVLKFRSANHEQIVLRHLRSGVTSLSQELGRNVVFDEVQDALLDGFSSVFGIEFVESDLSTEESVLAEQLSDMKYLSDQWTFCR
jgi:lipoate-protein ligase A